MTYNKGDVLIVDGRGVVDGVGIPKVADGKRATIKKVGKTRLHVRLQNEPTDRIMQMEDVRRVISSNGGK